MLSSSVGVVEPATLAGKDLSVAHKSLRLELAVALGNRIGARRSSQRMGNRGCGPEGADKADEDGGTHIDFWGRSSVFLFVKMW